jgi:glycosyltransferase involved in cell wall biosynthesis
MLALDTVGFTVVPRSVKMTNTTGEVPDRIKELEQNDLNGVDIVIQHNLPSEFTYKGGVRNVGIFNYETTGFPNTNWRHHLNIMDDIVVSCNFQKAVVHHQCGPELNNRVHVINHPVDVSKFTKSYDKLDFGLPKNCTKFYTIAEYGRRKNFPALFLAYFSAFTSNDNVVLVIKTHVPHRDAQIASNEVKGMIDDLRRGMNRFCGPEWYPKVILMTEYMTDDQISQLHNSCDVFVTASHGETPCLPAIDALGFGNPIIAPNYGGFKDYTYDFGTLIDGSEAPVFGVNNAPPGLYSSSENWYNVKVNDFANAMKDYHDFNWDVDFSEAAKSDRSNYIKSNFSYQTIGNKFKNLLEV